MPQKGLYTSWKVIPKVSSLGFNDSIIQTPNRDFTKHSTWSFKRKYLLFIPTCRIKIFKWCFLVFLQKDHNIIQWEIRFQFGLLSEDGSVHCQSTECHRRGKSAQTKDSYWDMHRGIRETKITKNYILEQNKDYFLGHTAKGFSSLP